MSRKAISVRVLKRVVKDIGDVFTTKDVSEDPRVMNAHRKLVKHSHYHAFVGGALSDHRDKLGIKEIQKGTRRGSRWQKKRASSGFFRRKQDTHRKEVDSFQVRKEVDSYQVRKGVDDYQVRKEVNHSQELKLEKIISIVCPACGGDLKKNPATTHYVCSHCRNEYIVKNGGSS